MTAAQTFKLTPAQVRLFLNPSDKAHHMTVKALKRLNLLDAEGWFTNAGKTVQDILTRAGAAGRTAEIVKVSNATRPTSALTMSEWAQVKDAVRQVAIDTRRSYPEMSDLEAIDHVQGTLTLPGEGCVGGSEIELDGSALSEAYRLVLTYPRATRQVAEFNHLG